MLDSFKYLIHSKLLNHAFKTTAVLLLLGLLYTELRANEHLTEIQNAFWQQLAHAKIGWLLLTLALMPFNWMLETQKWYPFIRRFEPMGYWKALRAVLAGVTVSVFLPNRVGEFGGRILFVRPEHRWHAAVATLVGNFAQVLATLLFGVIGIAWMMCFCWHWQPFYTRSFVIVAAFGLVALGWGYFAVHSVLALVRKIPLIRPVKCFAKAVRVLARFNRRELAVILGWSTLRYGIYITQYFFLLKFFDLKITPIAAFSGVSTLFLLQTCVPLPPLLGLAARGNLAVQIWGQLGANELSSLAATFVLWIINLILPALVGTFSIFYVNIAKTFVYENDQH